MTALSQRLSRFSAVSVIQPIRHWLGISLAAGGILCLGGTPVSASWVQDCSLSLSSFTVYSIESPTVQHSDILGLTGSEASVEARHFSFVRRFETQDPTYARTHACNRLVVLTGKRLKDLSSSSLSLTAQTRPAPLPQLGEPAPLGNRMGQVGEQETSLHRITTELQETSAKLLARATGGQSLTSPYFRAQSGDKVQAFSIDGTTLARSALWTFLGNEKSLFLVTVRGATPLQLSAGVELLSSDGRSFPKPGNILLHFPDAPQIEWSRGGANPATLGYNVGYPFIIVAPRAHIAATELLITGAVYARRWTGAWDFQAGRAILSDRTPTAQVNGIPAHPSFEAEVPSSPAPQPPHAGN